MLRVEHRWVNPVNGIATHGNAAYVNQMTPRKENPQPMGRPSKYNPVYCNEVIDFLSKGHSLTAFAGYIGINPDTVYEWQNVHKDFSDAVKLGRAKAVVWWEEKIMKSTASGEVTACIFGLKNRAPSEWRDKINHEITGENGGAIAFRWANQDEKHD